MEMDINDIQVFLHASHSIAKTPPRHEHFYPVKCHSIMHLCPSKFLAENCTTPENIFKITTKSMLF